MDTVVLTGLRQVDAWGYAALLARLRGRVRHEVLAPAFDREDLEQPVAGSIPVPPEAGLVVTEGNYLLLDSVWLLSSHSRRHRRAVGRWAHVCPTTHCTRCMSVAVPTVRSWS